MQTADPLPHLIPSNNAEHLGSVTYELQLVTVRPLGFESFPRLAERQCSTLILEREQMEVVGEHVVEMSEQQGVVGKVRRFLAYWC
jgi:hypothetical protein